MVLHLDEVQPPGILAVMADERGRLGWNRVRKGFGMTGGESGRAASTPATALTDASAEQRLVPGSRGTRSGVGDFAARCSETRVGDPRLKAHYMSLSLLCTVVAGDNDIGTFEATRDQLMTCLEHTRRSTLDRLNNDLKRLGLLVWTRTGRGNRWRVLTGRAALRLLETVPSDTPESVPSDGTLSVPSQPSLHLPVTYVHIQEHTGTAAGRFSPEQTAMAARFHIDPNDFANGTELYDAISDAKALTAPPARTEHRRRPNDVERRRLAEFRQYGQTTSAIRNCPQCQTMDRGADCHCERCGWREPGCPHSPVKEHGGV